jgi:hypothetical protein
MSLLFSQIIDDGDDESSSAAAVCEASERVCADAISLSFHPRQSM